MKILMVLVVSLLNVSLVASSAGASGAVVCKSGGADEVALEIVRPATGDSTFTLRTGTVSFAGRVPNADGQPTVYASSNDPQSHFIGSVQRDRSGSLSVRGAVTLRGSRALIHQTLKCL